MESVETKNVNLTYAVNQEIVYPLHGVGMITNIQERKFKDQVLVYYVIYIDVSDMTVMVPVNKADELGIRAIVTPKEAERALENLSEDYDPVPTDWKVRYQMNLELLKSGTVMDISTVVKTLYHRSKIKELPILERKLFDNALRLLIDEISSSITIDKEKTEDLVYQKMNECAINFNENMAIDELLEDDLLPEMED